MPVTGVVLEGNQQQPFTTIYLNYLNGMYNQGVADIPMIFQSIRQSFDVVALITVYHPCMQIFAPHCVGIG